MPPCFLLAVDRIQPVQGVGCSGGQNPDNCLPFVYSTREGQKGREQMEAFLLSLAGLSVPEVRRLLVQRQPAADNTPITQRHAEWVLKQAQHLREFKRLKEAAEAALPVPDFEECFEALPDVQLTPPSFDSTSGRVEERAARLLEVVLPREAPRELLAAARAQPAQGNNGAKKKQKKQQGAASDHSGSQQQQAELQAYEAAWQQQLAVLQENLALQEEQGLGEVSATCVW